MADGQELPLKATQWPVSIWRIVAEGFGVPEGHQGSDELLFNYVRQHAQELMAELIELEEEFGSESTNDALVEALLAHGVDEAKTWQSASEPDFVAYAYAALLVERGRDDGVTPIRNAFTSARFKTADISRRVSFEFQGAKGPLPNEAIKFRSLLGFLFADEGFSDHVEVEQMEGFLYVGRGGRLRSPVIVDQGRRRALPYRPAMTDALHYEPKTGVLRVTARTRRLAKAYAAAMGEAFFANKKHFEDGGTCSLDLLRQGVQALQPRRRLRVDRVHLISFEAVTGSASISGKAPDLDGFVRAFQALEFKEVRLRLFFFTGDKVDVVIRTDKGVTCERRFEDDVERYLEDVGIRGVSEGVDSFWELAAAGTASIQQWRNVFGSRCDELVVARVLQPAQRAVVRNVDAPEDLVVHVHDDGAMYGVGRHAEDGARVLTVSDVDGLKLFPDRLARVVAEQLGCTVHVKALDEGRVWLLGRKLVVDGVEPQLVLVLGAPSKQLRELISSDIGQGMFVSLWPQGSSVEDEPGVAFRWDELSRTPSHIVDFLGVRPRLPLEDQNPEGLAIDEASGLLTFKGAKVDLGADTAPHRLMLKLAEAYPDKVTAGDLDATISPKRNAEGTSRQAKRQLKKLLAAQAVDISDLISTRHGFSWLNLRASVARP